MPVTKWYNRKRLARQMDANGSQNANKIQNKCEEPVHRSSERKGNSE